LGHRLEDVLAGFQQQRQEVDDALRPIEHELSSAMLSPGRHDALRRRQGRLLHRREVLAGMIAGLDDQLRRRT